MAIDNLEEHSDEEGFEKIKGAATLVFNLIISQGLGALLKQQNEFIVTLLGERIKHGLNGMILEKVTKKSIQRDPTYSMGEITTLSQVDAEKISGIGRIFTLTIISPIQILVGIIWLFFLVGPTFIIGLSILIFMAYFNKSLSMNFNQARGQLMCTRDRRVKLVTEVFTNIRFIKMNGLENYFLQKIQAVKKEELKWLNEAFDVNTGFTMLNYSTPLLFLFVTFGTYILFYGLFSVSFTFAVIMIYDIFKSDFSMIPYIITLILDFILSAKRIVLFLLSDHLDTSYIRRVKSDEDESKYSVEISSGHFYWEDPDLRSCYEADKDLMGQRKDKKEFSEEELEVIKTRSKITNEGYGVDQVDASAHVMNQNARV